MIFRVLFLDVESGFFVKKIYLVWISLILATMVYTVAVCQDRKLDLSTHKWNSMAYLGYAWSKKTGVVNPDPNIFQKVALGDTDDNVLSNVPYAGMSLIRNVCDWLKIGVSFETYGLFAYQKSHLNGIAPSGSIVEFVGPNYTRSFVISHQSVMLDSYLVLPEKCRTRLGNTIIKPVFGGGVGIGISNLFNFQAVSYDIVHSDTQITTIGSNHIQKSLAWCVESGIDFQSIDSEVSVGVSYRYYNGGEFKSGNRFQLNDLFNEGRSFILPPWSGRIKANEIKMYININFN